MPSWNQRSNESIIMGNCSNISNTQAVSLTAGTLTSGFCHTSLQSTYEEFINRTTAQLSQSVAGFVAGDDTPQPNDQNKLWFKLDPNSCYAPLGWYYWDGTNDWLPVKTPVSSLADNTQGDIIYYGASGAPAVLNAGTDGHFLKTKGAGQNPEWAEVPQIGFTSNQGTPSSSNLGTSYTHFGTCTLTLPTGKTWLWVKVVTSFRTDSSCGVTQAFKITTDSDGTTLLDSTQTDAGWVYVDSLVNLHNSDDSSNANRVAEGVPTGHTTDTSLDLKVYMRKLSGNGDTPSYRSLYAVGQYA